MIYIVFTQISYGDHFFRYQSMQYRLPVAGYMYYIEIHPNAFATELARIIITKTGDRNNEMSLKKGLKNIAQNIMDKKNFNRRKRV